MRSEMAISRGCQNQSRLGEREWQEGAKAWVEGGVPESSFAER